MVETILTPFFYFLGMLIPILFKKLREKSAEKGTELTIDKLKEVIEESIRKNIWEQKFIELKTEEWITTFREILIITISDMFRDWGKEEITEMAISIINDSLKDVANSQDLEILNQKLQSIQELIKTESRLLIGISKVIRFMINDQRYREDILKKFREELVYTQTEELKRDFLPFLEQIKFDIQDLKNEILERINKSDLELKSFIEKFFKNYHSVPTSVTNSTIEPLFVEPPVVHSELRDYPIEYSLDMTKEYPLLDIIGVMIINRGGQPYYTQLYEPFNNEPALLSALLTSIHTNFCSAETKHQVLDRFQTIELGISSEQGIQGINFKIIQSLKTNISIVILFRKTHELVGQSHWEKFKGPLNGLIEEINDYCREPIESWMGKPLSPEQQSKIHTLIVRNLRTALLFPIRYHAERWEHISDKLLRQDIKTKKKINDLDRKYRSSLLLRNIWKMLMTSTNYGGKSIPTLIQEFLEAEVITPREPEKFFLPIKKKESIEEFKQCDILKKYHYILKSDRLLILTIINQNYPKNLSIVEIQSNLEKSGREITRGALAKKIRLLLSDNLIEKQNQENIASDLSHEVVKGYILTPLGLELMNEVETSSHRL